MPYTIAPFISRIQLQGLKTEIDKMNNVSSYDPFVSERIDSFVSSIYRIVLNYAENTSDRIYRHKIMSEYDMFYSNHLEQIIHSLQLRLPGCDIQKKFMSYGPDGKLREIPNVSYIEELRNTYIVIDWT